MWTTVENTLWTSAHGHRPMAEGRGQGRREKVTGTVSPRTFFILFFQKIN
jgi:hypothetical protein